MVIYRFYQADVIGPLGIYRLTNMPSQFPFSLEKNLRTGGSDGGGSEAGTMAFEGKAMR